MSPPFPPVPASPWHAHIITLFPKMFPGPLNVSVTGRALERGLWSLRAAHLRDFASGKHKNVDDTPSGGGPGMVMRADVVAPALDAARKNAPDLPAFYLSPRGRPFVQAAAHKLAAGPGAIFLCGRFEGLDQRVLDSRKIEEISIGDFVLAGGEIAAMAMIEACVRLLPGVLGAAASTFDESFENGLLEYPHYTRPAVWEGHPIPEVLTSGNHAAVAKWRRREAENITQTRRPDLWQRFIQSQDEKNKT